MQPLSKRARLLGFGLAALGLLPAAAASPVRLSAELFGDRMVIEVRDLPDEVADELIRTTFLEVHELEQAIGDAAVERVNQRAGALQEIQPELMALLTRATAFCGWADGVHGPLGGRLYALWGLGGSIAAAPRGAALRGAVEAAACESIALDPEGLRLDLPASARILLHGFSFGQAVDTAVAALKAGGATNGWVELGDVKQGFGLGPEGQGWPVQLPLLGNTADPLAPVYLRNQAFALARKRDPMFRVAGETMAAFLDQTTGRPKTGVLGAAVVTEAAADAEPLALTMFVLGNSVGEMRLGNLTPNPSVLWILGGPAAEPLYSYYRWSRLSRPVQR